ncbi:MAG TPA: hypothetical protein VF790_08920 [Dissulfurispiraceae bacterium]
MDGENKTDMNGSECPRLVFLMDEAMAPRFLLMLQRGFMVRTRTGCSVQDFLGCGLGISRETLERIQSIFLDGSPVDDLGSAIIKAGATLALSAAMPGLVGATLRRGGFYSSFRSSITYKEKAETCIAGEGLVRLKLFNLLIDELGPGFLGKGILVRPSDLADFLSGQSPDFWEGCKGVLIDGSAADPGVLRDAARLASHDLISLKVAAPEKSS